MSQHVNPLQTRNHKSALRRTLKDQRRGLPPEDRKHHDRHIAAHLANLLAQRGPLRRIALYLATPDEAALSLWLTSAQTSGLQLFAPVVGVEKGQMAFYPIGPNTPIRRGRLGLQEPVVQDNDRPINPDTLDVALVPLLGFDDHGHRLGMGGGYYDRYFSSAEQRPWIVGIAYDIQRSKEPLPTEPWDVMLDAVVTETGYRVFHR
ncbi:MAG: 5-formyltetrahydrofolate cyclo-ligase [Proteobacteria bacterium]|jgi:5-formyltetrahydrofolate cyclo-ligase|nr:5-formyltetrahydrofolate cyclo-ligase [Pseudomonadota bacterium]